MEIPVKLIRDLGICQIIDACEPSSGDIVSRKMIYDKPEPPYVAALFPLTHNPIFSILAPPKREFLSVIFLD